MATTYLYIPSGTELLTISGDASTINPLKSKDGSIIYVANCNTDPTSFNVDKDITDNVTKNYSLSSLYLTCNTAGCSGTITKADTTGGKLSLNITQNPNTTTSRNIIYYINNKINFIIKLEQYNNIVTWYIKLSNSLVFNSDTNIGISYSWTAVRPDGEDTTTFMNMVKDWTYTTSDSTTTLTINYKSGTTNNESDYTSVTSTGLTYTVNTVDITAQSSKFFNGGTLVQITGTFGTGQYTYNTRPLFSLIPSATCESYPGYKFGGYKYESNTVIGYYTKSSTAKLYNSNVSITSASSKAEYPGGSGKYYIIEMSMKINITKYISSASSSTINVTLSNVKPSFTNNVTLYSAVSSAYFDTNYQSPTTYSKELSISAPGSQTVTAYVVVDITKIDNDSRKFTLYGFNSELTVPTNTNPLSTGTGYSYNITV